MPGGRSGQSKRFGHAQPALSLGRGLRQHLLNHGPRDVREPEIAANVPSIPRQSRMVACRSCTASFTTVSPMSSAFRMVTPDRTILGAPAFPYVAPGHEPVWILRSQTATSARSIPKQWKECATCWRAQIPPKQIPLLSLLTKQLIGEFEQNRRARIGGGA